MRQLVLLLFVVAVAFAGVVNIRKRKLSTERLLEKLHSTAPRRGTAELPFGEYDTDDAYMGEFTIGTNREIFNLAIDLDTADVFIASYDCTTDTCQGANDREIHLFDPSTSETFTKDESATYSVSVHGHNCSGYVGEDLINLGGISVLQDFGMCQTYDYAPLKKLRGLIGIDGVFGLGFPDNSQANIAPPLSNFQDVLEKQLFSLFLHEGGLIPQGEAGGRLYLGEIDPYCDALNILYTPLTSASAWEFAMDGITIGSFGVAERQRAEITSRNSFIVAPPVVVTEIYAQTGARYDWKIDGYLVECEDARPDLVLKIHGQPILIPQEQYIIPIEEDASQCIVAFKPSEGGGFGADWQFGDPFLRSVCTIFDFGRQRIGFTYFELQD